MAKHFSFEKLSTEGQALAVRLYEDGATLTEIVEAVRESSGEEIGRSALHRYCSRVIEIEKKSRQAIKRRIRAGIEAMREDPDCSEAQVFTMLNYEAALARRDDFDSVDLKTLMQEHRRSEESKARIEIERAKLELERERNQIERDKIALKQAVTSQAEKTADEVAQTVKSNGLSDQAAAEIRTKILGIGA